VDGVPLDLLVTRLLARSHFEYRLAVDAAERDLAFRLRGEVVVERGWRTVDELPEGLERDEYDDRALHVLGWDGDVVMSTGRVVLPPGLPTEDACGIVVDPPGEVVDVGRMCVAPRHQGLEHAALIGLMCRLYLEMRAHGYEVACGMMSARAQVLVRHLGLQIEQLGAQRTYWNEPRMPVRFSLLSNVDALENGSWRGPR
jgi:N-acyl-L-homoserine lactone synthetase